MNRIIFIVALALASPSLAQSVPPPFTVAGAVPTIPQWRLSGFLATCRLARSSR